MSELWEGFCNPMTPREKRELEEKRQRAQPIAAGAGEAGRTDTQRLDWLARNQTINYGLNVGGYYFKSDLRWQETRIREAIDAAMNESEAKK